MNYRLKKNKDDARGNETGNPREVKNLTLIVITAFFLVLFDNFAFFKNVTVFYPLELKNLLFLLSLALMLACSIIILFSFLCFKFTTKPVLITILMISSLASYFMNTYNIVIDGAMIRNVMETNSGESFDLINIKLFLYLFLIGILPSIIILKLKIIYKPLFKELLAKLMVMAGALLIVIVSVFSLSNFYISFFRVNKILRFYSNPTYYVYAAFDYITETSEGTAVRIKPIGTDAVIPEADTDRELVILVVGEAARADRFSLAGYERKTNPLLEEEDVTFFSDMHSCGTSTSVSVPCMFSVYPRKEYSDSKARSTYNVLDVLNTAGINILWRDNNSDSKGVALRVPYEDFRTPEKNTVCDIECRDEGMLSGLQEYINSHKTGDIIIVLHQMGNHGPVYHKRYPESFEKFTPVCKRVSSKSALLMK